MATIDATANSIYSMIGEVMSDYRAKAIQIVGTLPVTGVAGTIYVMSKSEPNEKNRFIAYVFENGKYVQVGSSFFPEDFEHDAALSTTSHVTVENRAIHAELQNKYNVANIIDNVVYNDEHGTHANDTPTSAAIQRDLAKYMGYEDGSRISDAMLWQIFRPELARLVYPYIKVRVGGRTAPGYIIRLANRDMLTNLKYKSGLTKMNIGYYGKRTVTFYDVITGTDVRVNLSSPGNNAYTDPGAAFYDSENYPNECVVQLNGTVAILEFEFLDPVSIGMLDTLCINFKTKPGGSNTISLEVTTKLSDTGETGTYTTIQNNVEYDGHKYVDGIPFYGFSN
jgi:hypothetical protein